MYTSFFGLNEKPFSITPDPRYLFMSERHGEALAHLVYGVTESGGFMQLTGEVGTGKTTLVRTLLQSRMPENADVAVVLNPQLSAIEFLQTIAEELGIPPATDRNSSKALTDALNHYLLMAHAEGRRTILIVDEAQNLARDVLEQVRLLTNLETSKQKLLQIILIGQPELRDLLARNDLRQLAQRITGRYHLEPLTRQETAAYIEHRVRVAGAVSELFDASAKKQVFRLSQGVPRLVNVLCDRALLGAYGHESRRVSRQMVERAAAEISGKTYTPAWLRWLTPVMVTTGLVLIGYGVWSAFGDDVQAIFEPRGTVATPSLAAPAAAANLPGEPGATAALPASGEPPISEIELAPPRRLDDELMLAHELTGNDAAFATLLKLWAIPWSASRDACEQARLSGYECLAQRGSWNSLRQFDRPAILTLTDSRGDTHAAVLTAIRGDLADLSIGGLDVTHSIDDVSELWFGQFLIIWKPAHGVSAALGPGSQNPNVVWLRESLAAIDPRYRADPLRSDRYDRDLENRVRDFQRDHRLMVDGLAGRQTQIVINSLTAGGADTVPRLTRMPPAQD